MKFIMEYLDSGAVNVNTIHRFYIERVTVSTHEDEKTYFGHYVRAKTNSGYNACIAGFIGGDSTDNFEAAQKYLAEFVAKLNEEET